MMPRSTAMRWTAAQCLALPAWRRPGSVPRNVDTRPLQNLLLVSGQLTIDEVRERLSLSRAGAYKLVARAADLGHIERIPSKGNVKAAVRLPRREG